MGAKQVFDLREKAISKQGAGMACPYCGGPVLRWEFDAVLRFCFITISHKTKTKLFCAVCSTRLVPVSAA